jgi:hypothetical protein
MGDPCFPSPVLVGGLHLMITQGSGYEQLMPAIDKLIQEPAYYPWLNKLLKKYIDI